MYVYNICYFILYGALLMYCIHSSPISVAGVFVLHTSGGRSNWLYYTYM